jgi:hypothetical protein
MGRAERTARPVARQPEAAILPGGRIHPNVETRINRMRGAGRALPLQTRASMESIIGAGLADVRVHDGTAADGLARAVQARAFATGRDLFFARGEYRPGTSGGERLLAHELTHIAQQRGASTGGPLSVSQPGDAFEREADRVADGVGG